MKLLRNYTIASLISMLAALGIMWMLYQTVVMGGMLAIAEQTNVATAQSILASNITLLADYLADAAGEAKSSVGVPPVPTAVDEAIRGLTRDANINRIKIYNRHGIVSASTNAGLIGADGAENPGFVSAMSGRAMSNLVRRDTFNPFDRAVENANLLESYVPVRRHATEPVLGVLEIYTDVNRMLAAAQRTQLTIVAGTALVLAILYTALLFIVRHARNVMDAQQHAIQQKIAAFEQLVQRNQRREQHDRKKLAADLHEGLAQALSAIKFALEAGEEATPERASDHELLKSVVPGLRDAISQVRAMAVDLHPSSLEDLGLTPTIRALCRQLDETHPSISVESRITIEEGVVPDRLQIVLYRSVETGFRLAASQLATTLIRIAVTTHDGNLSLVIEGNGTEPLPTLGLADLAADTLSPLTSLRESTIISGGKLAVSRSASGSLTIRSSWRL
jgi:signal transduction histidine kinase